jgi:hypothetical protein
MDRVRRFIGQCWPCLAGIFLLWGAVARVLATSLCMNQGHLVYALDDSYILMAMAKNFARHGVWGITPFQFTASSSGPLWTLLVACLYRVFGINTSTPLILNLLIATLLVLAVRWILVSVSPALPNLYILAVLVGVLFFSPVINLIFLGLEHTLHMLGTLLFIFYAGRILAADSPPSRAARLTLIALGVVISTARYEGLFAVAVVAALLFVRRRAKLSVELAFWSVMPAFILGAISVGQGWFWLPNSVALKGNLPVGETNVLAAFLARALGNTLYSGMRVVRLEGIALLLMLWRFMENQKSGGRSPRSDAECQDSASVQMWMMGIFAATATLHLMLAATGWFFRYEAYLIAAGITVVAAPMGEFIKSLRWPRRLQVGDGAGLAALAVLVLSAKLLWGVGYSMLKLTPLATHDTFRWHYQMGTFVSKFYQGRALAVNDIGAVDFMADIHLTDPQGLADREIGRARLRNGGKLTSEILDQIARSRGVTVALVDENWVDFFGASPGNVTPSTWLLAGTWKFHYRFVLAPTGLSFYALDEAAREALIENLRKYSPLLPRDVEQWGPYTQKVGSKQ